MPTTFNPSKEVKKRIAAWEGDAMIKETIDPLSKKLVNKNNSFEKEAKLFYYALPESIRQEVLSNQELADNLFSYSYNVGSGNFAKRVVPKLLKYYNGEGSPEEVAMSMRASGDSKLRGLAKRRHVERGGVVNALSKPEIIPVDNTRVIDNYASLFEDIRPLPVVVPANPTYNYVDVRQVEPEEWQHNDALAAFKMLERAKNYRDSMLLENQPELPQREYNPTEAPYLVTRYDKGGNIEKKKTWDELSVKEKADMMRVAVENGITSLSEIKDRYNAFAEGGNIYDGITEESQQMEVLPGQEGFMYNGPTYAQIQHQIAKDPVMKAAFNESAKLVAKRDNPTKEVVFYRDVNGDLHPTLNTGAGIISPVDPLGEFYVAGKALDPIFKGVTQGGRNLYRKILTSNSKKPTTRVIQAVESTKDSPTLSTLNEIKAASEKDRKTLIDWINSSWYKQRLEDEPLYKHANTIIEEATRNIETAPFDYSKTSLELIPGRKIAGLTSTKSPTVSFLSDGTEVTNLATGLDINVASDINTTVDNPALHELLHYMTANSKGSYVQKGTEKVVDNGWLNPLQIHFDLLKPKSIIKRRSTKWQDYVLDQNNALLPQKDVLVEMAMEHPDDFRNLAVRAGKTPTEAENMLKTWQEAFRESYDIQEQRAYLQELFLKKIKPNIKNPNDAKEIEEYLINNQDILSSNPFIKKLTQQVRPGNAKDYAKYFSAALSTLPFMHSFTNSNSTQNGNGR